VDVTFDELQGKMMKGVTVVEIAADKSMCKRERAQIAEKATGFLYSNFCLQNWARRNKPDPSSEPFKHSIGCSLGANCTTGGFVLLEKKGSIYSSYETFELADTERIIEPWLKSQDTGMVDLCVDVTFDELQGKMMKGVTVVEIAADKSMCRRERGTATSTTAVPTTASTELEDKAEFFGLGKTGAILGAGVVAVVILILINARAKKDKYSGQTTSNFGSGPAKRTPQQRRPRRRH
jgi:hypothetical protein